MIITETIIRVRYADTDQMKMVYYSKFLEYFEQGRSDLLREVGMPYPELEQMGYYLPVVEVHAKYVKAARYDDEVVERLGFDPARYAAGGVGVGLDRLACLRYGIDDIRKVTAARI